MNFTIDNFDIRPCQRTGQAPNGRRYTPKTYRQNKDALTILLKMKAQELSLKPTKELVRLDLVFHISRKYCKGRNDMDNLIKNFCDAAQGILYENDSQVVSTRQIDIVFESASPHIEVGLKIL